ncbi:hypothetical protein C8Q76DRAFT_633811 [Earliella scabrosa]|nr:hypothetical protein C8Q76DRAFT_633811 [Earliella scabrosa]
MGDLQDEPVSTTVARWKLRRFRQSDLPLESAVASLHSDRPLVHALRTGPTEWTFCKQGTRVPAVFSYAAVFADADDYQKGNLDLNAKEPEAGEEDDGIARFAGLRANYSYAMDTRTDYDLFGMQSELDLYMQTEVDGFNPRHVVRRTWQSGNAGSNFRFWFKTPIFLRLKHGEKKPEFPAHLHEEVRVAKRKSRSYRANPARPTLMSVEGGRLKMLQECTPNHFVPGDVLAVTFNVAYIEADKYWYAQFMPVDLVRVRASGSARGCEEGVVDVADVRRAALQVGELVNGKCVLQMHHCTSLTMEVQTTGKTEW